MSNFVVRKVAVLGAGVMGAQIAAHCVNARVPVVLFDLPARDGPKNGIVLKAIDNLKKLSPAPLGVKDDAQYIQAANYEEHLELLRGCDVIIEAIAERMDWKHDLYRKVAPYVRNDAIFASNTSGLPIAKLAEVMDAGLKARFCGVHFFNPPRYMHLVELIPTPATQPAILDDLETFLTSTLGKGVVRAKDTPNFIANRVGIFGMLATIKEAEKYGLAYDVVDDLTGSKLGRAKSATFRTADVVGLDTMAHVIKTMQDTLPASVDPFASNFATPPVLKALVEKGALGQKAGAGFYRKEGKAIKVLDPKKGEYVESGGKADELVVRILKKKDPAERLKLLRETDHPQAKFLWAIFRDAFHYIAVHLESIADTARDVDFALRWGFGWATGPFETWQAAGWKQIAEWVRADIEAGEALSKAPLPKWVFDGPVAKANGVHTSAGSWSPAQKKFIARSTLPVYARQIFRAPLAGEGAPTGATGGKTVFEDESVRLWTLESGLAAEVLIMSIKTKVHAIGPGVIAGLLKAIELAEAQYRGLVIWSPDEPFSVGADLQAMMPVFMSGGGKAIGVEAKKMQDACMRLKYAQVPTIAAVSGMALGGGCELILHCSKAVASLESYIGLVEIGVGLVPGSGGLKEGALRAAQAAQAAGMSDVFPFMKNWFMNVATANVSKSALEAKAMGYLRPTDTIVFNSYELLWTAVGEAFALQATGYRPPLVPLGFPVAGRTGVATIKAQLANMRDGGFISAHDFFIASGIADAMCGGDVEAGALVDEQWLLDLERSFFVTLVNHPKTQERIMGMLQTGKPVRN
ncbi:MAG TPA: 3-hydroxyacyl-CoA dehydrogenase NAD-binding domain-containing protein [Burkholderiaceae bacterium]|nr:3-hydroxyacyl-CoA dehydrogenase NAD-binding domain-containing protein [Burkholderiaceae bacterium]HQR69302.1 3-hydroxyacyl-CoA dehydrogenase NAD-binding domain-containing protein [Burkholderiaceae bacterium]